VGVLRRRPAHDNSVDIDVPQYFDVVVIIIFSYQILKQ